MTQNLKKGTRIVLWGISQNGHQVNGIDTVLLQDLDPDCYLDKLQPGAPAPY